MTIINSSEWTKSGEITDVEKRFKIIYIPELGEYILAVWVEWIAAYYRYYIIDKTDYEIYKSCKEKFYEKFSDELSQLAEVCFNRRFIGADALRDYDGQNRFQDAYPMPEGNKNTFIGYGYEDGILYAHIVWENNEIYVPPFQRIKSGDDYEYPLREKCTLQHDTKGNPICYKLKIERDINMTIIYSSENKIFGYDETEKALTEIPCEKVNKYRETVRNIQQRKEWKTTGTGANFMGMATADMINPDELPVRITGLSICGEELVYGVNLEAVGSIYHRSFDPADTSEGLVRASNDFLFGSFDIKDGKLAVCMGSSSFQHVAVMDMNGRYDEYTDGDTIEENPCWAAKKNGVYFSTAGYARDQYGVISAVSPRTIAYLDLDRKSMTEVVSDENYDFLHPREAKTGELYYIRQPYGGEKPQGGITFKDVIMFPYRMIKGIFGFFNFFATIFGGESLKSGGVSNGTKSKQRSQKDLIIEGNVINAEKLDKINEAEGDKLSGIMPQSRMLIKCTADGSEEIIKKGVLDYILDGDGNVIVSNGRHLLRIDRDGNETHIAKAKLAVNLAVKN